jgi:methionyl-tRNA formyltransferase
LHDKLAMLGGSCMVRVLAALEAGQIRANPQSDQGVSYANKIEKHEAMIDWSLAAITIERQIRAFNPFPVASTSWRGELLRVWRARAIQEHGAPGRIEGTDGGILVGCGSGALLIQQLQRAGGKPMLAAEFLRGVALGRGEFLGK